MPRAYAVKNDNNEKNNFIHVFCFNSNGSF